MSLILIFGFLLSTFDFGVAVHAADQGEYGTALAYGFLSFAIAILTVRVVTKKKEEKS